MGKAGELVQVGGKSRRLYLEQQTSDPDVAKVTLAAARSSLRAAFRDLPKLALELEAAHAVTPKRAALDAARPVVWSLSLDEIQNTGVDFRPRLPFKGPGDFTGPELRSAKAVGSQPLSSILAPVEIDPLTVADDPKFLARIAGQSNLPSFVRTGLPKLYR